MKNPIPGHSLHNLRSILLRFLLFCWGGLCVLHAANPDVASPSQIVPTGGTAQVQDRCVFVGLNSGREA